MPIHLGVRREHDDLVARVRKIAIDQVLPMRRVGRAIGVSITAGTPAPTRGPTPQHGDREELLLALGQSLLGDRVARAVDSVMLKVAGSMTMRSTSVCLRKRKRNDSVTNPDSDRSCGAVTRPRNTCIVSRVPPGQFPIRRASASAKFLSIALPRASE